jgi:hypothetical protein
MRPLHDRRAEREPSMARANPAKVEDFGDKDLLQHIIWRESFSAK